MNISERVEDVRRRIAVAAEACGRAADDITIVAASKTRSVEEIEEVLRLGITEIGENRVQEFTAKWPEFPGANWHLLGPLQRNKVRKVVGKVSLIHAVDSQRLAESIDVAAGDADVTQDVLLEVNIDAGPSRYGVAWADIDDAVHNIERLGSVRCVGLMGIPSIEGDASEGFRRLRDERDRLQATYPDITHLSMGMSGDLEAAIEAGATLVRPGSALFGPRPT